MTRSRASLAHMSELELKRWMDRKDTAAYLSVDEATVRRWTRAGLLSTHRLDPTTRRTWYDRQQIDAQLEAGIQTREAQESA